MRIGRRKKPFVILGCGPSGLFAAHALAQAEEEFEIHSRKRRSEMFGAQYLHAPIPRLSPDADAPWPIEYKLVGDSAGYREKVYGPESRVKVSPEMLLGLHQAWDIRAAYYAAWNLYNERIRNVPEITPAYVSELGKFHRIVSSLPAPTICTGKHEFASTEIWAVGDAPERGVFCPVRVEPWTVVCDGTPDRGWYRAANVFDYCTAEWPGHRRLPPLEGVARVVKPVGTNCDCFPGVLRIGRYGTWNKLKLSHEAYTDIWKVL